MIQILCEVILVLITKIDFLLENNSRSLSERDKELFQHIINVLSNIEKNIKN